MSWTGSPSYPRYLPAARRGVLCIHEYFGALRPDARWQADQRFYAFCMAALAEAEVALVMGSAFGAEGYARLSFATDLRTLERGFDALDRVSPLISRIVGGRSLARSEEIGP